MTEDAELPVADLDGSGPGSGADPETGADGVSRRKLLIGSVGVMSGAIAAGVGVPAIFYIAGPAQEQGGEQAAPCRRLPMDIAVTVLPQPDSPTRPTDFPASTVKLTLSTARTQPESVLKLVTKSWISNSRLLILRFPPPN